jgi:uncharacterized alkaline shock family protein YloU
VDKTNTHEEVRDAGMVCISDDVVAVIAGLAASEVAGVAGMGGTSFAGSVSEMLGKKNLSKGVKVQVGEKQVSVDLYIIVEHGARIPVVARSVQENVKNAIANMTGLEVVEANVHVQGVYFPDTKSEEVSKTK